MGMQRDFRWIHMRWPYYGQDSEIQQGSNLSVIIDQVFRRPEDSVVKISVFINQENFSFNLNIFHASGESEYQLVERVVSLLSEDKDDDKFDARPIMVLEELKRHLSKDVPWSKEIEEPSIFV